jgi:hypothetical protein
MSSYNQMQKFQYNGRTKRSYVSKNQWIRKMMAYRKIYSSYVYLTTPCQMHSYTAVDRTMTANGEAAKVCLQARFEGVKETRVTSFTWTVHTTGRTNIEQDCERHAATFYKIGSILQESPMMYLEKISRFSWRSFERHCILSQNSQVPRPNSKQTFPKRKSLPTNLRVVTERK